MKVEQVKRPDEQDHRWLVLWAADCAEHVLPYFEKNYPDDVRPRQALEAGRGWVRGELLMRKARDAAFAAHAAAHAAVTGRPEPPRAPPVTPPPPPTSPPTLVTRPPMLSPPRARPFPPTTPLVQPSRNVIGSSDAFRAPSARSVSVARSISAFARSRFERLNELSRAFQRDASRGDRIRRVFRLSCNEVFFSC